MIVLGVEFAASQTTYVLLEQTSNSISIKGKGRVSLGATRSSDALRAYQSAVQTLLNDAAPDLMAIKEKPEHGAMQAGAAALKMEGILLANTTCRVTFVSGARINKCETDGEKLFAYYQAAFKAALAAIKDAQ